MASLRVDSIVLAVVSSLALACGARVGGAADETGGTMSVLTPGAGGAQSYNVGSPVGGVASIATGGTRVGTTTGSTSVTNASCANVSVPTATGNLSIAAGYVTVGALRGYGFTWKGDMSNSATCISPVCNVTGCTPAFGTSALCGAGVVGADMTYNSVVGIGMNVMQDSSGGPAASGTVGEYVTIGATLFLGADFARVQITSGTGASATNYCVEAGSWAPGVAIPVTMFNTECWDGLGATLVPGVPITSVHLQFPSSAVDTRAFSACLTNVVVN